MPVYYDKKTKRYFFKVSINSRQFLRRGFQTKAEAKLSEINFLKLNSEKNKNTILSYKNYMDLYCEFLKTELKITTYANIRRSIKRFYSTLFPDIRIDKLTYSDVEKARRIIDKSTQNTKTKNRYKNFLIRFFKWIYLYYDYDFKEIQKMKSFKNYEIKRLIKNKSQMVQFEDFITIYKNCNDAYYRLAFITFYLFGLRLGELLGLKVDSFDFEKKQFEIYQGVSFKTGNGGFVLITPKTEQSQRITNIPPYYITLLQKHINDNNLKKSDYIFFRRKHKNQPCPEQTFRRHANTYCKVIDSDFHFHLLRKSTVTYLRDKGISLEDIKDYVGHSDVSITKNIYLQESNEKKEMILEVMNGVLEKIKE